MELERRMNRWETECPGGVYDAGEGEGPASARVEAGAADEPRHMVEIEDGIFFRKDGAAR